MRTPERAVVGALRGPLIAGAAAQPIRSGSRPWKKVQKAG
jgi:hypothetical protein